MPTLTQPQSKRLVFQPHTQLPRDSLQVLAKVIYVQLRDKNYSVAHVIESAERKLVAQAKVKVLLVSRRSDRGVTEMHIWRFQLLCLYANRSLTYINTECRSQLLHRKALDWLLPEELALHLLYFEEAVSWASLAFFLNLSSRVVAEVIWNT